MKTCQNLVQRYRKPKQNMVLWRRAIETNISTPGTPPKKPPAPISFGCPTIKWLLKITLGHMCLCADGDSDSDDGDAADEDDTSGEEDDAAATG